MFSLGALAEPLTPMAFAVTCSCSQLVFAVQGISLNVQLPDGMDLIAVCRCGRKHSLREEAGDREATSHQEHS